MKDQLSSLVSTGGAPKDLTDKFDISLIFYQQQYDLISHNFSLKLVFDMLEIICVLCNYHRPEPILLLPRLGLTLLPLV